MTDAVLSAGFFAIVGKVPLAAWTAVVLFWWADRRSSSVVWPLLLASAAGVFALGSFGLDYHRSATSWTQLCRLAFVPLAFLIGFRLLGEWLKLNPKKVHEETSGLCDDSPVSPGKKRRQRKRSQSGTPARRDGLLLVAAMLVAGVCVCLQDLGTFTSLHSGQWTPSQSSAALMTVSQAVSTCVMLGISLFSAVQLTILSSPDMLAGKTKASNPAQRNVRWAIIDYAAMVVLAVALVLALRVFTSDKSMVGQELASRLLPIVFAIALVLLHFVAWMIPHRLHGFQRSGEVKEWTSLTLAAWLSVLSFTLLCGLPASWPWLQQSGL